MAKDLFIFTLNSKGEFKRVKWEDVIEQRSTGKITTKRNRDYRLSHGEYINKSDLDKIRGNLFLTRATNSIERAHYDVPIELDGYLRYSSFEDNIPDSTKNLMYTTYYNKLSDIMKIHLANMALAIKDVDFSNLNSFDFKAFFENPMETYYNGILNRIKETMVEGN